MINLTPNERKVLRAIATNEYNPANGRWPETKSETGCWADALAFAEASGLRPLQVNGVLASLKEKALIRLSPDPDRPNLNLLNFTDAGWNLLCFLQHKNITTISTDGTVFTDESGVEWSLNSYRQ